MYKIDEFFLHAWVWWVDVDYNYYKALEALSSVSYEIGKLWFDFYIRLEIS